jgi:hypothetical protein
MRTFQITNEIHASCERVWSVLADVESWPQWTASMSKIELLDGVPLTVGSRARVFQPKLRPAVWTISDWQPNVRFAWIAKQPGLAVIGDHALKAAPAGCAVTLSVSFQGLLSPLAVLMAGKLTGKYLQLESAGLKARSEGS